MEKIVDKIKKTGLANSMFFKVSFPLFMMGLLILLFIPIKQDNNIRVFYNSIPSEMSGKISLLYENEIYEQQGKPDDETYRLFEITYVLRDKGVHLDNIAFELQYGVKESYIKAIEIYNHHTPVRRFAPVEIVEYFDFGEGESYYYEGPYLVVKTEDESPSLIGNDKLQLELQDILCNTQIIRCNLFFVFMLFYVGICLVYLQKKRIMECLYCMIELVSKGILYLRQFVLWFYRRKYYVGVVILLIVELCIFLMAVKSKHYAHVDEHTTKMAIDYYLGKWLKPNPSGSWMAGTFSHNGVSRLNEPTWYYLVAGKLGWFFAFLTPFTVYYRMLNVLLFGIMVVMTIKYGRREKWMFFVLLFTPQLWYIFSYATSDAWDFFWSFIILFELLYADSCLNKLCDKRGRHQVLSFIWCGFIFANIFLAKKNYYSILLFAFIILLFRLYPVRKEKLIKTLPRYFGVLVTTYGWYNLKVGLDRINLHIEKAAILVGSQVEEISVNVFAPDVSFAERFQKVFMEKPFFSELFQNFTGSYCWNLIWGPAVCKAFFGVLYLLLLVVLIYQISKCRIPDKFESVLMFGIVLIMIGAVGYWSMYRDYQAQGRYLLPIILVIAYMSTKKKEIYKSIAFHSILFGLAILSLFSYVFMGLRVMAVPYMGITKIIKEILRHG